MAHRRLRGIASMFCAGCLGARGVVAHADDADGTSTLAARAKAFKSIKAIPLPMSGNFKVMISLPPDYDAKVEKRVHFNTLYVLDEGWQSFAMTAGAARVAHDSVKGKEGRQWHPELIVVGIASAGAAEAGVEKRLQFLTETLVPTIDGTFNTLPYAAARAVLAHDTLSKSGGGTSAMLRLLLDESEGEKLKMFRFFMLQGGGGASASGERQRSIAQYPEKTAVRVTVGGTEGDAAVDAAKELQAELAARSGAAVATSTTMFVNRDGEQTYTEHTQELAPPVSLDVTPFGRDEGLCRAVVWLCERLERQKLESLGSLLPWHEFK